MGNSSSKKRRARIARQEAAREAKADVLAAAFKLPKADQLEVASALAGAHGQRVVGGAKSPNNTSAKGSRKTSPKGGRFKPGNKSKEQKALDQVYRDIQAFKKKEGIPKGTRITLPSDLLERLNSAKAAMAASKKSTSPNVKGKGRAPAPPSVPATVASTAAQVAAGVKDIKPVPGSSSQMGPPKSGGSSPRGDDMVTSKSGSSKNSVKSAQTARSRRSGQ